MIKKNIKGMTLIEIVIGLVVMSIILVTAVNFVMTTITTRTTLKQSTEANNIASDMIEHYRALSFNEINESSATLDDKYICETQVTDSTTYKVVTVIVSWPVEEPKGNVTLSTIIGDK